MKLKALILYAASVMAVLAVAAGILSGCRKENAAEAREHMTAARIIVSPDLSPAESKSADPEENKVTDLNIFIFNSALINNIRTFK